MKLKIEIEIEMDNAAFDDGNEGRDEAAAMLEKVRLRLLQGTSRNGYLLDHNGNSVGTWAIKGKAAR